MKYFDFSESQLEILKQFLANPEKMINSFMYLKDDIYLTFDYNSNPCERFGKDWERIAEGYALWTTTTEITNENAVNPNASNASVSRMLNAGLPNIKSDGFNAYGYDVSSGWKGAVYVSKWNDATSGSGTNGDAYNWYFDANHYNSIYGKSDTVQPPAIKIYAWRRISVEENVI